VRMLDPEIPSLRGGLLWCCLLHPPAEGRGRAASQMGSGLLGGRREDTEVGYGGEGEEGRSGGDGGRTRDEEEREGGQR
jgi:hypothetical protein